MKKRILPFILPLLIAVCLFAGCQEEEMGTASSEPSYSRVSEEPSAEESITESQNASEASSTDGESPEESTEESSEEPDFFTAYGQGVLPEKAELPAVCKPTDKPYLYDFPMDLPDTEGFSAQVKGDILHLSYWTEESMHRMYSLKTGELLCELTLPGWSVTGFLEDGSLWCADLESFELCVYAAEGTKTILQLPGELLEVSCQNVSLSPDGEYLLALSVEETLFLCDLEKGTCKEVLPEGGPYWSIEYADGQFYLPATYGVLSLDPADGSTVLYDAPDSYGSLYGSLWHLFRDGALVLGETDPAGKRFYAFLPAEEAIWDVMHGCAVTNAYDVGNTLRFYDLREGVLLAEYASDPSYYGIHAAFLPSGAVLILEFGDDGANVRILDLPAAAAEGEPVETLLLTDAELAEEIRRLAEETEASTGVDLLYGSEGNDFVIYDYIGEAETDLLDVYLSVKQVSELLALYPEGMLREAYEDTHRGLLIYLCGAIYGKTGSSLSQAGGLTTEKDGYILVAVDVHNNLAYDIPHELSHVFDRRITYVSEETETDWMAIWEQATPVKNAYLYTYDDYSDNYRYTAWNESKDKNVWFVDGYARTFPTEDRARIMENLFNPASDGLAEILRFDNLQTKAKLYCYILRECFASCDTDTVLYWETHLGTIDDSVIPQ
ncbi:MAG: WD40 repeat domain-containing protein [Clostridia bacterium]|nr:WD40 repeat domain-containing protein [Clostridia bacterium]